MGPKILVTGATGQQGRAVAHELLKRDEDVRLMSRHPEKLGPYGIYGDFNDPDSLATALEGIERAFLVTAWKETGNEVEIKNAKAFIDAAKQAGVSYIVLTSVAAADAHTGIPFFESKSQIEAHLKESGLSWCILRPAYFMENLGHIVGPSGLSLPVAPDTQVAMIAVETIGQFGAAALLAPERFASHTIPLASEQITFPQAMALLSDACGHPLPYTQTSLEKTPEPYKSFFSWLNSDGFDIDIDALNQWGIHLTPLREHFATAPYVRELSKTHTH